MSLRLLIPRPDDAPATWPTEPFRLCRGSTELDRSFTLGTVNDLIDSGCLRADQVAVLRDGAILHRAIGETRPVPLTEAVGDVRELLTAAGG
jgi:sulfur carrier protein ThiS